MKLPSHVDVVVVGAGISGLCAAHWLKKRGHSVLVLEQDSAVGGTMKSVRDNGYLYETGPNSALETTPLFKELIADVHLEDEFMYADPAGKNRFILKDGGLLALPLGPGSFLTTPLFSWRAKLRLLKEPFVGRATREESIAQFVERRLGREFLSYAIDPFVAGVYAGMPERLSVRAAFPKLYALEKNYGGLIKGMIGGARERRKRAEKAKDRAETFSFRGGMQVLPQAIAASLDDSLLCSAPVTSILPHPSDGHRFAIQYRHSGTDASIATDSVLIAAPAHSTATLVRPLSEQTARILENIYYPPVASVFVVFDRKDIRHPLDGFGFLIPSSERRKILGALWSSSLFPHRCPDHAAAFTVFVGGSRQPENALLDDGRLVDAAIGELKSIMQIDGKPLYLNVTRWQKAIPQYELGYLDTVEELKRFENQHAGLFFCSNFVGGISVGDCVMSAHRTSERVDSLLRQP